jgi:hypothetical protein
MESGSVGKDMKVLKESTNASRPQSPYLMKARVRSAAFFLFSYFYLFSFLITI